MDLFSTTCFIVLFQVISAQDYHELRRDKCLDKALLCIDHRVEFSGDYGPLETNPNKFEELCRNNQEFTDCIENAADYCSRNPGNVYDLSSMFIENRRHMKLFCTNEEWKKKYFASTTCINVYKENVEADCATKASAIDTNTKEVKQHLIDPCSDHVETLSCAIKRVKLLCGMSAGEVYRRLKVGADMIFSGMDIICELSRRDTKNYITQDYLHSLEDQINIVRRVGPLSPKDSESINKIIELTVIDTMIKLFSDKEIDNILNTEDKLRKILSKQKPKQFHSTVETNKVSEQERYLSPDLWTECLNLFSDNMKKILLDTNIESSKLVASILQNLLKDSCKTKKLALEICFEKLQELIARAKHSKKVGDDIKILNDFILGIFERLTSRDLELSHPSEGFTLVSTDIVKGFPLKSLNCTWNERATKQIFQCTLKLNSSLYFVKEIYQDTRENVNKFHPEPLILNSKFTECGKSKYSNSNAQETEFKKFSLEKVNSLDNDDLRYEHRIGNQSVQSEEAEYIADIYKPEFVGSTPPENEDNIESSTKIADSEQSEETEHDVADLYKPEFVGTISPDDVDNIESPTEMADLESSLEEYSYVIAGTPFTPTDKDFYAVLDIALNATKNSGSFRYEEPESNSEDANEKEDDDYIKTPNLENEIESVEMHRVYRKIHEKIDNYFPAYNQEPDNKSIKQKVNLNSQIDNFRMYIKKKLEGNADLTLEFKHLKSNEEKIKAYERTNKRNGPKLLNKSVQSKFNYRRPRNEL